MDKVNDLESLYDEGSIVPSAPISIPKKKNLIIKTMI